MGWLCYTGALLRTRHPQISFPEAEFFSIEHPSESLGGLLTTQLAKAPPAKFSAGSSEIGHEDLNFFSFSDTKNRTQDLALTRQALMALSYTLTLRILISNQGDFRGC